MALCANNCGNEANGRSKYCSPSCKVAYNRNKTKPIETNRNNVGGPVELGRFDEVGIDADGGLHNIGPAVIDAPNHDVTVDDHGVLHLDPKKFAERAHPEKLNWGDPMTLAELESSSFVANRVSIPGDWDYKGTFN